MAEGLASSVIPRDPPRHAHLMCRAQNGAPVPKLSPHVQNYNFSGLAKLQLVSPRGLDFGTQRQLSSRHRYRIGKSARWVHVVPSASSEMPRPRPPPASARRRHPPPPAPCARSTAARPCRPAASSDTTPQKSTQKSKVASAGDPKVDRSPALAKLGVDLTKFAQTRCTHPAPNRPLAARRAPQMRPRQRPQNSGRPPPSLTTLNIIPVTPPSASI